MVDRIGPAVDPADEDRSIIPGIRSQLDAFVSQTIAGLTGRVVADVSCRYTMTPDEDFILDRHPAHPQIVVGVGLLRPRLQVRRRDRADPGRPRHPRRDASRHRPVPARSARPHRQMGEQLCLMAACSGKVAIVTGGASGIGRAIAERYAARGCERRRRRHRRRRAPRRWPRRSTARSPWLRRPSARRLRPPVRRDARALREARHPRQQRRPDRDRAPLPRGRRRLVGLDHRRQPDRLVQHARPGREADGRAALRRDDQPLVRRRLDRPTAATPPTTRPRAASRPSPARSRSTSAPTASASARWCRARSTRRACRRRSARKRGINVPLRASARRRTWPARPSSWPRTTRSTSRARSCSRRRRHARAAAVAARRHLRAREVPGPLMRRVGVDIGGTFTDLILVDDATGAFTVGKSLTTPDDPSRAVETRAASTPPRGTASTPAEVDQVDPRHDAGHERDHRAQGRATALLATAGFRDAIEIGREHRYDLYDLYLELPRRSCRATCASTCRERMLADGTVAAGARRGVRGAPRGASWPRPASRRSRSLPAQLRQPGRRAAARDGRARASRRACASRSRPRSCPRSASTSAPRPRSRTSTSRTASSGTSPSWSSGSRALGFGGVLRDALDRRHRDASRRRRASRSACSSRARPRGALAAAALRRRRRRRRPAVVRHGRHHGQVVRDRGRRAADRERVRGRPHLPLQEGLRACRSRSPVDRDDRDRRRRRLDRARRRARACCASGPDSAGADPGPVCYGRGGTEPTVTDADLVLGYLDPGFFLGGRMALDLERRATGDRSDRRRRRRWAERSRRPPGASTRVVNENMANAARVHAVERGQDPRGLPLFAFGGAGPVHASGVAARARLAALIAPFGAGVMSTVGFLVAPLAFDFVRTWPAPLDALDWDRVERAVGRAWRRGRRRAGSLAASAPTEITHTPGAPTCATSARATRSGSTVAGREPDACRRCAPRSRRCTAALRPPRPGRRRARGDQLARASSGPRPSRARWPSPATPATALKGERAGWHPRARRPHGDAGLRPLRARAGRPPRGPGDRRGARVDARHRARRQRRRGRRALEPAW